MKLLDKVGHVLASDPLSIEQDRVSLPLKSGDPVQYILTEDKRHQRVARLLLAIGY